MSFSIVCVIHDSADELDALLASVARHVGSAEPQVVVVDTASTDRGTEVARAHGAEVVELGANPGFGAANDAGVARARHPACVLLNPDVVLHDDGLLRLVAAAQARDALHVPRLRRPDGSTQDSAHVRPGGAAGIARALLPAAVLPRRAREALEPWRADRPRPVGWAIAAAVAARTATLRELGPFDPDAFLFYEDLDFCLHAAATGRPTLLDPTVVLEHVGGHSTGRLGAAVLAAEARRRRDVVGARLGPGALARDDLAQGLELGLRSLARRAAGADATRPTAQLAALRAARRN